MPTPTLPTAPYAGPYPAYFVAVVAGTADQYVHRNNGAAETFANGHSASYAFPCADATGTGRVAPTALYGDGSAADSPLAGLPDGSYELRWLEKRNAGYDVVSDAKTNDTQFWVSTGTCVGGAWYDAVRATAPDGAPLAKQADVTDALTPARLGKLDSLTFTNPGVVDASASVTLSTQDKQDIATAVVDGIGTVGGLDDNQAAQLNIIYTAVGQIVMGVRPVVTPVQTGTLTVIQGDSYLDADGVAKRIPKAANAPWPTDLTGWTITVGIQPTEATASYPESAAAPTLSLPGVVVTPTGDSQAVRFDLSAADSASLLIPSAGGAAAYRYNVRASNGTKRVTLEVGSVNVIKDATA